MIVLLALFPEIAGRIGFCESQNDERCVLALVAPIFSCYRRFRLQPKAPKGMTLLRRPR
jgi:hypothetical protein